MQQSKIYGQYWLDTVEAGPQSRYSASAPSTTLNPASDILSELFAEADPPPEPIADHVAEVTTSRLLADAATPADAGSHVGGCACGACALPGIEIAEADAPPAPGRNMNNNAGPEGIAFDAAVNAALIPTGGAGIAYGNTFKLHSLPGAKYTVYLDFDGHTTSGSIWNSYWGNTSFYSSAFSTDASESFNTTELLRIQQIWARVAEYFSPFNINVTTQDPGVAALSNSGTGDASGHGIRVVITDEIGKAYGGIAYKGSFSWNDDTPTYVYASRLADNPKNIADAAAHEVGHSLGLSHDGRTTSEYYYGHGAGATDWAPVLGVGYNANIVQWSNGGYNGATNVQDDLTIITTANQGVNYRADDHGNTFAAASKLGGTVAGGIATVKSYGVINGSGARNDIDMFSFEVGAGGAIDLTVNGWTRAYVAGSATPVETLSPFSMLDVALKLYNSSLGLVAQWDDATRIDGVMKLSGLAAGTYYVALDGVGWGNPSAATPTGYTEYGSLGQYMIRGTYSAAGDAGALPPPPPPPPPVVTARLELDKTVLTTTEGASQSFTVRAAGVSHDVTVQITGLNATQGALSASEVLLNASNNWTATVGVSGVQEKDADGDVSYDLKLNSLGLGSMTLKVTSKDNDVSATTGGKAYGTYTTAVGVNNATVAVHAKDDGKATIVREGTMGGVSGIDYRWEFTKLTAGDKVVQVDAWSTVEAFRFEYSTDSAVSWRTFEGVPASALSWNGNLVAEDVGSSLWVRLVDTVRTGDLVRDTISFDLVTLAPSDLVFV